MNLDLRYAPHLHFARDTAEENAARIGILLEDISKENESFKKDPDEN
jgi:ribosome-binding factor A